MFESPNTQPLEAAGDITDLSVMEVVRRCSNLQSLNLEAARTSLTPGDGSSKTMFESPHTQPLIVAATSQTPVCWK